MNNNTNDLLNIEETPRCNAENSGGFWTFRTMITPVLIQVIFWLGVVGCILGGIITIKGAYHERSERWDETQICLGLAWIFVGPLLVRIYCEFAILFFRMNETLTEIRDELR